MLEENLIDLCRKERRDAQKLLFERYQGRMFRIAFRYIRERQAAEDVLMHTFTKVFRQFSSFEYRGAGSLEKWITRIVVNESLMHLRSLRIRWTDEEASHQLPSPEQPTDGMDAERLYALIRQLPDGYRIVFNLYAIEGFTHPEIAEQLGIAVGTSKSQLSKARALLQQWLTEPQQKNYEPAGSGQSL